MISLIQSYLIWLYKTLKSYHDALGQIVEDSGLQLKDLPTDDGVRQRELQEEGLENCELSRRSQTQTFGGQTEGLRLPRGDGVRNRDRNLSWSRVPVVQHSIVKCSVNLQGLDIEMVDMYKYLAVHINNKLDWSDNISVLYKKGQSRLQLLMRLINFGVCRLIWKNVYDIVVASATFFAVISWSGGITEKNKKWLNALITECYQR